MIAFTTSFINSWMKRRFSQEFRIVSFLKWIFKKITIRLDNRTSGLFPLNLSDTLSQARNTWASLEMPVMVKDHAFASPLHFEFVFSFMKKSILEHTDNFKMKCEVLPFYWVAIYLTIKGDMFFSVLYFQQLYL